MSRTTVREVFRELDVEGLVTMVPQKGAIVAVPSPREADELFELRALLEGLAARQFCQRASETKLQELRRALKDIEQSEASADHPRSMIVAANRFYDVLLDGADNQMLSATVNTLRARVVAMRAITLSVPGRASRVY